MVFPARSPAGAAGGSEGGAAVLIRNPTAGRWRRRRRAAAVVCALEEVGWRVEERVTAAAGEATRIAAEAADAGAAAVFVFAGDGTVREAAAGLLAACTGPAEPLAAANPPLAPSGPGAQSGSPAGSSEPDARATAESAAPAAGPALGVLPGGTTNVLAYSLGWPADPIAAARAHAGAVRRAFDVGYCGRTPFLLMVSAGLDAHAVEHVDPRLKRRLGKIGVGLTGVRRWWSYRFPPIALTVDGEPLRPVTYAIACNTPHYAGRFAIAPAARWDDGRLDLVVQRGRDRWSALGFDLALARGRHLRRPDVAALTAREIVLDGPDELRLQVDGDLCREPLPVTIRVAPGRLPVLVPGWRLSSRTVRATLPRLRGRQMSHATDTRSAAHARAALRALMNGLGLSQLEMADMLQVSGETVDRWWKGSASVPVDKQAEIVAAESSLQRLHTLFRPDRLSAAVRRPADLFGRECALQWILRGRIAEVTNRYEAALRYQA